MKKQAAIAVLYAALGNIIWGFSFLFTKTGLAVAPNPNVMLAHRFTVSTLLMLIPLLLVLNRCFGAMGLVCSQPAADSITLIIGIVLYIKVIKGDKKK